MVDKNVWDFLMKAGLASCALFIVCCVLTLVGVLYDMEWFEAVMALGMIAALALMVVGFFVALFNKKWLMALAIFGGSLLALVIGFLAVILIGVGQHHPPKHAPEDLDSCYVYESAEMDSINEEDIIEYENE